MTDSAAQGIAVRSCCGEHREPTTREPWRNRARLRHRPHPPRRLRHGHRRVPAPDRRHLADFEGRFVVHGEEAEVVEGHWPGNVVVIGFPDRERAGTWYDSPAYQTILPPRTDNPVADVIFVNGVADGYRAADRMADPAAGPGTGRAADEAAERRRGPADGVRAGAGRPVPRCRRPNPNSIRYALAKWVGDPVAPVPPPTRSPAQIQSPSRGALMSARRSAAATLLTLAVASAALAGCSKKSEVASSDAVLVNASDSACEVSRTSF
ncbi:DUF1330 domain-containing protein, partial [Kitasatospora sp. NPDC050543]|uniref:DUF1330 domain-containing protein n=1 Tax=Kitasatospora sp. NPDC050543 TaxID=3364054 RepID=UPI0037A4609C